MVYAATNGWETASGSRFSETGTTYVGGASVTNLASAGSSITLYAVYDHTYTTRSSNNNLRTIA